MKKLVMLMVLFLSFSGLVYANCGNDNGNGEGCEGGGVGTPGPQGPTGPQGPVGPQGSNGANGTNGSSGAQGKAGATGATGPQGPSGDIGGARLGLDVAVRLYDSKRFQVQLYNIYSPSTAMSGDALGDGKNLQYGVRMVFKLGKSYEETLIEKQSTEIKELQLMLSRMDK